MAAQQYEQQLKKKSLQAKKIIDHVNRGIKDVVLGKCFDEEPCRSSPVHSTCADIYIAYSGYSGKKYTGILSLDYYVSAGHQERSNLRHDSALSKPIKVIKDFMEKSGKPIYDPVKKKGFWYSIKARSNHAGKVLLIVEIHTDSKEQAVKDCDELAPYLLKLFTIHNHGVTSLMLKSVYEFVDRTPFKQTKNIRGEIRRDVIGAGYVDGECAGLIFRIRFKTPQWVSALGSSVLCEAVAELLELNERSVVVEIGNHVGIIGLYLAKMCNKVFIADRENDLLATVTENAKINGITNCEIIGGALQKDTYKEKLRDELVKYDDVAAVVSEVLSTSHCHFAKECTTIDKLVLLILCNGKCLRNLVYLCTGDNAFNPVKVIPVDMNPGADEIELAFLLKRENIKRSTEVRATEIQKPLEVRESKAQIKRKIDDELPPRDTRFKDGSDINESRGSHGGKEPWNYHERERQSGTGSISNSGPSIHHGNNDPSERTHRPFDSSSFENMSLESAILDVVEKAVASNITFRNQDGNQSGAFRYRFGEECANNFAGNSQGGLYESSRREFSGDLERLRFK